mgnify:CR=1 FL=1
MLTREHGYRKQQYVDNNGCERKTIWIFEYFILFIFVVSIIVFEILYNILMVFTQLSTQVKGCQETITQI